VVNASTGGVVVQLDMNIVMNPLRGTLVVDIKKIRRMSLRRHSVI